jgi:hypothetical protein
MVRLRKGNPKPWYPNQPTNPIQERLALIVFGGSALVALFQAFSYQEDANTLTLWTGSSGAYGVRALLYLVAAIILGFIAITGWQLSDRERR